MSLFTIIVSVLCALCCMLLTSLELKRQLQMMQQNSYRIDRYRRWMRTSGDTTSFERLTMDAVWFLLLFLGMNYLWGMLVAILASLLIINKLRSAKSKKPLVMTPRAWRIFTVATVLEAVVVLIFGLALWPLPVGWVEGLILCYGASCMLMIASVWLLGPVEKRINRGYYDDAASRLRQMPSLKIIGITGSYGKTSTKHYLQRILSEQFETLMTPGSYNTTMGVIRTVREYLKPYHEVFIVEMGAKAPGDIKEICDLVHPQCGIITAVGEQHLESFKSIGNVQRTKFELADALPADGLAVVNNDFEYVANRPVHNVQTVRYGVDPETKPDVTVSDIVYSPHGTTFTLHDHSGFHPDLKLSTRLVGECNVSNLMAAVVMARALGVPDEKIRYAVERIDQVEHRLNMKTTPGGITIIDDAFNSNPVGSRMALDVLKAMTGGQRIVITPGMIELGERQEELNRRLGRKIASSADVAIVVGEYNRDSIVAGINDGREKGEGSPRVETVDSFKDAQTLLMSIGRRGDTVLYENDLPDTFK